MTKEEAKQWLKAMKSAYALPIEAYEALDFAIESLSAEDEWIPCSDRLPKVGQDVLFCGDKWTGEGYMREDGDWFQFRWSAFWRKEEVIAWMPLTKPYREEMEDYDYELATEQMEHYAMYEPTYNPEDGSM